MYHIGITHNGWLGTYTVYGDTVKTSSNEWCHAVKVIIIWQPQVYIFLNECSEHIGRCFDEGGALPAHIGSLMRCRIVF